MRTQNAEGMRLRVVRAAALLTVATVVAGCSADASRFQDSFYTGAIPQNPVPSASVAAAAPTYGAGQPNASYGAGTTGDSRTFAAVATPPVSRSALPPPPAASYGDGTGSTYQASPAPASTAPVSSAAVSQTSAARGMASASDGTWKVTSGDSVLGIARRTGVSSATIRSANGLTDDNIRIGQVLRIPGGNGNAGGTARTSEPARVATLGAPPTTLQAQAAAIPAPRSAPASRPVAVQAAPTMAAPAPAQTAAPVAAAASQVATAPAALAVPAVTQPTVAQAAPAAPAATTIAAEEQEEVASLAPKSTGIEQFRWPVQGRVVKNFGDKVGSRRNDGLNISVPRGTPVKAAENGVVIYAGEGLKEFGKTVLVKHDDGLVTVYGHADEIMVQRGATVKRGQEIAKAGMTGDTDTPMLHFEVRKDSSPVNPMTYLQ